MSAAQVRVLAASLFAPGVGGPASTFAIAGLEPGAEPQAELLGPRLRRGSSVLSRLFVDVTASLASALPIGEARLVFGSAWGEVTTSLALLEMRHGPDGLLSPVRFKNSVHNAGSGFVSIATSNREPSTAIASGHDTLAMCLLEAMGWLGERDVPVIVAVAEETPPPLLAPRLVYPPFAAALVLVRASTAGRSLGTLGVVRRVPAARPSPLPTTHLACPAARVLPLLSALATRTPGTIALGEGDAPFCIDVGFSEVG